MANQENNCMAFTGCLCTFVLALVATVFFSITAANNYKIYDAEGKIVNNTNCEQVCFYSAFTAGCYSKGSVDVEWSIDENVFIGPIQTPTICGYDCCSSWQKNGDILYVFVDEDTPWEIQSVSVYKKVTPGGYVVAAILFSIISVFALCVTVNIKLGNCQ